MRRLHQVFAGLVISATLLLAGQAQAQFTTEEKFQDVFITAGYATAFGAALGAATLSFFPDPSKRLQHVAIGASLGFIGGSLLGSYMVFSPGIAMNDGTQAPGLIDTESVPTQGLAIRPVFDRSNYSLASVEGAMTLLRF